MAYEHPVVVRDLVARYGSRTILDGVDVTVRTGEIRVILGGSGSGKSTLLKTIIGLLKPAAGRVELLGCDLALADEPEREKVLGRIGMMFQAGALLNSMTLHDNVALPLRERTDLPASIIDDMVTMKLEMLDLGAARDRAPKELSGGMLKRAAIARAMALDPEILFFDEPSAGLDPVTAAGLDSLLLAIRDRFGMAMVVITHELESIRTIADQVTMLGHGRVIADGPLDEIEASDIESVRAFFRRIGSGGISGKADVYEALTKTPSELG